MSENISFPAPHAPELPKIASGFESAHQEWLSQGAHEFKKPFRLGAPKEFYATHYWKLVRQAALGRDCFKCFRCGSQADQVHHLCYSFIGEDHLHPETLVSVCRGCHGVVEYGRKALELACVIDRRISLCYGFIEGQKGCGDQNTVKVFSRLLEYRDRLAKLEQLYEAQTPYNSKRRIRTGAEEKKAFRAEWQQKDAEYQRLAKEQVNSWVGSESEKVSRIIPLLEREIEKCRDFSNKAAHLLAK